MAITTEAIPHELVPEETITRFDKHQIIQHIGLMVSFTLLVVTGVPLKFANLIASQWWVNLWGGIEVTRSVHYFAAWMMCAVGLYHLLYIAYSTLFLKRPFSVKMLPRPLDSVQFFQELAYFAGLRKERPKFDRFSWREKVEYWAIFWGISVMAGSGFVLMFPVAATRLMPGWIVPTGLVVHSYEAMMALAWIVLVHIFFSHFAPGVFPIDVSIFTGKVSKERYRKEHPLEYEELMGFSYEEEQAEQEGPAESDITTGVSEK
ncbi:formate dehydrogenase subunit gamma [Chloroflexota bacterium]